MHLCSAVISCEEWLLFFLCFCAWERHWLHLCFKITCTLRDRYYQYYKQQCDLHASLFTCKVLNALQCTTFLELSHFIFCLQKYYFNALQLPIFENIWYFYLCSLNWKLNKVTLKNGHVFITEILSRKLKKYIVY